MRRYRFFAAYMTVTVTCFPLFPLLIVTSHADPRPTLATLRAARSRVFDYRQDFLAVANARQQEPVEFRIAMGLVSATDLAYAHIDAAATLLAIDEQVSCRSDRAAVQQIILNAFRFHAKVLAILVQNMQDDIARTKVPSLALSGSKFRDDLRQLGPELERPILPAK
jgi:hypothetical protein